MSASDYLTDAQRNNIADEAANDLELVTKRHFPRTQNLEYAVLKAHLIVEFAITEFIRCTSSILVDREKIRFTFSQKLEIAALNGLGAGCSTTIPSIEILNQLRNQVAHRFAFDNNLLDELILINSEDIDPNTLTDRQRIACLRNFCAFLCGTIAGQSKMAIVVTEKA